MLRTPRYKYVAFPEHESILFDLETDPDEFENLSQDKTALSGVRDISPRAAYGRGFSWESRCRRADGQRIGYAKPRFQGTVGQRHPESVYIT